VGRTDVEQIVAAREPARGKMAPLLLTNFVEETGIAAMTPGSICRPTSAIALWGWHMEFMTSAADVWRFAIHPLFSNSLKCSAIDARENPLLDYVAEVL
jgi:hypothetical protein